jgi:hemerythrin superfamily protein
MIKMKKNILAENMKRFNTKNLNENIKTNSDFIETVETIMVGSLKSENMTDYILAELGEFYNDVTASNNTELKQLYTQLRMTADETPKTQSAAAVKLFSYLHKA